MFESILKPYNKTETAVIGGPIEAFEFMANTVHAKTLVRNLATFVTGLKQYRPTLEYFPQSKEYLYASEFEEISPEDETLEVNKYIA